MFFSISGAALAKLGVDFNNGLGDLVEKLPRLTEAERAAIEADLRATLAAGPGVAMVNSDQGITNLHVPSDVIVDASMPAMIRAGGKMYDAQGKLADTLAVIPEQRRAGLGMALLRAAMALYSSGCVKAGSSLSLWPRRR